MKKYFVILGLLLAFMVNQQALAESSLNAQKKHLKALSIKIERQLLRGKKPSKKSVRKLYTGVKKLHESIKANQSNLKARISSDQNDELYEDQTFDLEDLLYITTVSYSEWEMMQITAEIISIIEEDNSGSVGAGGGTGGPYINPYGSH